MIITQYVNFQEKSSLSHLYAKHSTKNWISFSTDLLQTVQILFCLFISAYLHFQFSAYGHLDKFCQRRSL